MFLRPPLRRYGMGRGENTGWQPPAGLNQLVDEGPQVITPTMPRGSRSFNQPRIPFDIKQNTFNKNPIMGGPFEDRLQMMLGDRFLGSGYLPNSGWAPQGPTAIPTNWANYPGVGAVPMAVPVNAGPTGAPTQNVLHTEQDYKGRGPKICKYCKGKGMIGYWPGRGMNGKMASLQPTKAADYISAGQTMTSPDTDKEIAAISPQESIFNPKQLGALSVKPSQKHKLLPSQVKAIFAANRSKA